MNLIHTKTNSRHLNAVVQYYSLHNLILFSCYSFSVAKLNQNSLVRLRQFTELRSKTQIKEPAYIILLILCMENLVEFIIFSYICNVILRNTLL